MFAIGFFSKVAEYMVCCLKIHRDLQTHSKHIAYTHSIYGMDIIDFFLCCLHSMIIHSVLKCFVILNTQGIKYLISVLVLQ